MTRKKVAILTQPLGTNYGGIIQNYALQKVLEDMGYDPKTIDRIDDNPNSVFKITLSICKSSILKNIFQRNILTNRDQKKLYANTRSFLKKHIDISPKIKSSTELKKYFEKVNFNSVIVGSDQTWRPSYSPNIYDFYLDFLKENDNIKKLAYATSFGVSEWEYTEEQTKKCSVLVQKFNAVSVREDSGIILCREKLGIDAIHLLDPTLLLKAEDYSQLINKPHESKQLFTYVLDLTEEKKNFIKKIEGKLTLKQHTNQAKYKFNSTIKRKFDDYVMPPVEGWLQGFRDAEFVITDSFHGTIFSIINEKPFITLANNERGVSRFESLLSLFGLEERLVNDTSIFDEDLLNKTIDYTKVHQQLDTLRAEAFNFLKKYL